MKKIFFYSSMGILLLSLAACFEKDPVIPTTPCTSADANFSTAVNVFDRQWGSPFQNQVVANFKLEQVVTSFSGQQCSSTAEKSSIRLKIQNITNRKMTIDYYIQYSLNAGGWNYQGAAVINPNSTYDAGEISQKTSRVNNSFASIVILSNSIIYQ